MNPYVYSKRRGRRAQSAQVPQPALGDLVKHIVSATVGTAVAFAVVLFAAGSVASMVTVAYAEIGGASEPSIVHVAQARRHSQVLGESTTSASQAIIADSDLEAGEAEATLFAKPGVFDSATGRWSAVISYSVTGLTGSATLSIGNHVIKNGITDSGSIDTGSVLKPGKQYRVTLWTADSSGAKQILAKIPIRTAKGKAINKENQMFLPCATAHEPLVATLKPSSTPPAIMCLMTKEGKMLCPHQGDCGQKISGDSHDLMPGAIQKPLLGSQKDDKQTVQAVLPPK